MGQRGPTGDSADEQRAKGNPRQHAIREAPAVGTMLRTAPHPYDTMSERAKAVWFEIAPVLVAARVLRSADLRGLRILCTAIARHERIAEELDQADLITIGSTGQEIPNKLLDKENQAATQVAQWCARFGLDPASRLRMAGAEGADDPRSENPTDALPELAEIVDLYRS
jgi:P27 family predicted phage terminase small subunit